jgi:hypothetical protein
MELGPNQLAIGETELSKPAPVCQYPCSSFTFFVSKGKKNSKLSFLVVLTYLIRAQNILGYAYLLLTQ